jgi:hypothetical protein
VCRPACRISPAITPAVANHDITGWPIFPAIYRVEPFHPLNPILSLSACPNDPPAIAPAPRCNIIVAAVVAADSLIKRDILRLPDPFAIVSVDGEQIHTTSVIKRTLNPYWNE